MKSDIVLSLNYTCNHDTVSFKLCGCGQNVKHKASEALIGFYYDHSSTALGNGILLDNKMTCLARRQ